MMAGDRLMEDLFIATSGCTAASVNLYGSTELGVIAAGDPPTPPHTAARSSGNRCRARRSGTNPIRRPAAPTRMVAACYGSGTNAASNVMSTPTDALPEPDGSFASSDNFRSNDVGRLVGGYLAVE